MRTVQKTYTLFTLSELDDEARQRAYADWLAKGSDYPYVYENRNTLEAFCNLFRIVCANYRYDSCTYAYHFRTGHGEETERLSGVRLLAYLYNNLQPLMNFMRSPDGRNFKELMRDCLENFFRSCRDDCEYVESEEYFTNESHSNNWEYLFDGTLFKGTA